MQDFGTTGLHYPAGEVMVMLLLLSHSFSISVHASTAQLSKFCIRKPVTSKQREELKARLGRLHLHFHFSFSVTVWLDRQKEKNLLGLVQ